MNARLAFQPKGAQAQWVPLYEYARGLPFGTLISYEMLEEITGVDVRTLNGRSVIYQAKKHLQKDAQRSLVCVPKRGYKIPHPDEHPDLAVHHRKKAGRQVTRALREVRSADRAFASGETKERLDFLEGNYKRLASWSRRAEKRINVLEKTTVKRPDHVAMAERVLLLEKAVEAFRDSK